MVKLDEGTTTADQVMDLVRREGRENDIGALRRALNASSWWSRRNDQRVVQAWDTVDGLIRAVFAWVPSPLEREFFLVLTRWFGGVYDPDSLKENRETKKYRNPKVSSFAS